MWCLSMLVSDMVNVIIVDLACVTYMQQFRHTRHSPISNIIYDCSFRAIELHQRLMFANYLRTMSYSYASTKPYYC
jgi:hypothetical protein